MYYAYKYACKYVLYKYFVVHDLICSRVRYQNYFFNPLGSMNLEVFISKFYKVVYTTFTLVTTLLTSLIHLLVNFHLGCVVVPITFSEVNKQLTLVMLLYFDITFKALKHFCK